MKSKFILTVLAVVAISLGTWAGTGSFEVDTNSSQVSWNAKKVGGQHEGLVRLASGNLSFADGMLAGGSFVVDMSSISVTDIEKAEMNAKLVGHLNSPDFFNTTEFPKAVFEINEVEKTGDNTYTVNGDLTIKGITAPISFPATVTDEKGATVATAELEIDRTVYDVRYGSKKFFDNLGNKFIYDTFTLSVRLVEDTAQ